MGTVAHVVHVALSENQKSGWWFGIILTMKNRGLMGFKKIPQLVGGLEHLVFFHNWEFHHPN